MTILNLELAASSLPVSDWLLVGDSVTYFITALIVGYLPVLHYRSRSHTI